MSLNGLFSILKGGPKSGNRGHAGRLGKRGGSASSSNFLSDNFTFSNYREVISAAMVEDEHKIGLLYLPGSRKMIASKTPIESHDQIAARYIGADDDLPAEQKLLDTSVHLSTILGLEGRIKLILFDTEQSGSDKYDKSMKNIYDAMDNLVHRGFPKGTHVRIRQPRTLNQLEDIDTTL